MQRTPPGSGAAPRSRRSRRLSWAVTATAALVAGSVAAACGSSGSASHASSPSNGAPGSGTTGSRALAAAYASSVGQHSSRFSAVFHTSSGGTRQTYSMRGIGGLSGSTPELQATMSLASLGTVEVRLVGGTEYLQLPPSARTVSGGKPWLSVDLQQATGVSMGQLAGGASANPADALGVLEASSDRVVPLGTATVRGVPTTGYRAVVDLDKVASTDPRARQAVARAAAQLHTHRLPVSVWIDGHHLVRRLEMSYRVPASTFSSGSSRSSGTNGSGAIVAFRMRLDLYGYGVPVSVSPPPPSDVQPLDLSNLFSGLSGTTTTTAAPSSS